jgi:hypothetical protein
LGKIASRWEPRRQASGRISKGHPYCDSSKSVIILHLLS